MARITVVGAGVVGLTCAVRLLEAGHRVDVLARELPLETTSAVAAALWYPYRVEPQDRVLGWSSTSYAVFAGLATSDPDARVRLVPGAEVLRVAGAARPWWAAAVPDWRTTVDLPTGFLSGWSFTAPVVEMPAYLRWLVSRVAALGGTLTRLTVPALPHGPDVVVNCSGLGARRLGEDPSVTPVRGQVVHVEQFGLERWWLDASGPTYLVPRRDDVVVGGTDEPGEWSPNPSPDRVERILARAAELVPAVREARVLRHRVGLRPARPAVRLERVGEVIHCYGHGGAGVTVSWGVADDVVALVG